MACRRLRCLPQLGADAATGFSLLASLQVLILAPRAQWGPCASGAGHSWAVTREAVKFHAGLILEPGVDPTREQANEIAASMHRRTLNKPSSVASKSLNLSAI
jgi:hypothetical protein